MKKKKIALFCAAPAVLCAALLAGCSGGAAPVPDTQPPVSSQVVSAAPDNENQPAASSNPTPSQTSPSGEITLEDAKKIAADDAKASNPVFSKAAPDRDDGAQIYDVELIDNNTKYDYEIDAKTGAIRERDRDVVVNPTTAQAGYITPEAAVDAAEKAANLSGGILTKNHLDHDDGRAYYEIEIVKDGMKYEFEINAANGAVLEQEKDRDD